MLSIGLMSGTSMDGVEAALLRTTGLPEGLESLGYISLPYEPAFKIRLKSAEYAYRQCLGDRHAAEQYYPEAIKDYLEHIIGLSAEQAAAQWHELAENNQMTLAAVISLSTEYHAMAVEKLLVQTGFTASDIDVVGYPGQTLFHRPQDKISIIVGDGQWLANRLGITVVNDFRRQDIQAGGWGAPFAPVYHQALAIKYQKIPLAVINCGGIANVTLIPSDQENDLIGYDAGPGNALIDSFVRQRTQGREQMDQDGQYAKQGKVDQGVLADLYDQAVRVKESSHYGNFLLKRPPKGLDYGDMVLIPALAALSLANGCRTLAAFTAECLVRSFSLLDCTMPSQIVLAGGGWNNPVILAEFRQRLAEQYSEIQVQTADQLGWDNQAIEAQLFAYLAVRSLAGKPLSYPGTTQVPVPMPGGQTFYPLEEIQERARRC